MQQIFKIKPLQTTVIAFRTTEEYRKMMKKTCVAEMKNLVNVEMSIEQVELKMPKEQQIPPIPTEEIRKTRVRCPIVLSSDN